MNGNKLQNLKRSCSCFYFIWLVRVKVTAEVLDPPTLNFIETFL